MAKSAFLIASARGSTKLLSNNAVDIIVEHHNGQYEKVEFLTGIRRKSFSTFVSSTNYTKFLLKGVFLSKDTDF